MILFKILFEWEPGWVFRKKGTKMISHPGPHSFFERGAKPLFAPQSKSTLLFSVLSPQKKMNEWVCFRCCYWNKAEDVICKRVLSNEDDKHYWPGCRGFWCATSTRLQWKCRGCQKETTSCWCPTCKYIGAPQHPYATLKRSCEHALCKFSLDCKIEKPCNKERGTKQ